MPRVARRKILCAYADEELPKLPKVRKPRVALTDDEKAWRKLEREIKAGEREQKKEEKKKRLDWEAKLPVRKGDANIPNNTKVMFISDAKKQFALSDREIESLPVFQFNRSGKRIIALSELLDHATERLLELEVSCPAIDQYAGMEFLIPNVMTKTSNFLTGLLGRRDRYGW